MSLRWCESPGNAARIAALSADQAPTAIIGCPHMGSSASDAYLWRAVDAEGEVLDVLVQTRRNKRAALKLMRKLLKKYGFVPDKLVTDDLRSYGAAASELGLAKRHERG